MANKKKMTRRDAAQGIGIAAGASLLAPGLVYAAVKTPSQTAGPFYPVTGAPDRDLDMTVMDGHTERAEGEVILVRGRVLNTDGQPLDDAVVDIWQANHHGRYSHPDDESQLPLDPNFHGWGITRTDGGGAYGFRTIKPAPYRVAPTENAPVRCRHIHYKVSCAGFETVTTQMYFDGDPLIEGDLVMDRTPEELRHLLIAPESRDEATGLPLYSFDVVLAKA